MRKKKVKVHRIEVAERCKAVGIENAAQLYDAIKIGRESCYHLWTGKAAMVRTGTIDLLCALLDCNVEDIFVYDEIEVEGETE